MDNRDDKGEQRRTTMDVGRRQKVSFDRQHVRPLSRRDLQRWLSGPSLEDRERCPRLSCLNAGPGQWAAAPAIDRAEPLIAVACGTYVAWRAQ